MGAVSADVLSLACLLLHEIVGVGTQAVAEQGVALISNDTKRVELDHRAGAVSRADAGPVKSAGSAGVVPVAAQSSAKRALRNTPSSCDELE